MFKNLMTEIIFSSLYLIRATRNLYQLILSHRQMYNENENKDYIEPVSIETQLTTIVECIEDLTSIVNEYERSQLTKQRSSSLVLVLMHRLL